MAKRSIMMRVFIPRVRFQGTEISLFMGLDIQTRRRSSDGPTMEHLKKIEWIAMGYPFNDQLPLHLDLPWTSLRKLPYSQLRHVHLEVPMTLQDCSFIFENAAIAEDILLKKVVLGGEPLNSKPRIPRHSLRSLMIEAEVNISPLFHLYDTSQLRCLDLDLCGQEALSSLQHMVVPWRRLTQVRLCCCLSEGPVGNIVVQLDSVEKLSLGGYVLDDDTWVAGTACGSLGSLKSFELAPMNDAAAAPILSHFSEHILPTSIECIDAPFDRHTFKHVFSRPFASLEIVNFTQPITPEDFLSFLALSCNLVEGSFLVKDFDDSLDPLSSESSPSNISFRDTTCGVTTLSLELDFQLTSAKPLLDALTLPQLKSLSFTATNTASPCSGLCNLLKRSRGRITSLLVDYPKAWDEGVLELLMVTSETLEVFKIEGNVHTSTLGKKLCLGLAHGTVQDSESPNCLCPRLERVSISPCRDARAFYEMVRSRSEFPSSCSCGLRKLRHVEAGLQKDQLALLNDFERDMKEKNISPNIFTISSGLR
ncbi:hypothetical protein AN958_03810 [Leucoagaricus sp. SymC.cos]|nr:hypothetical protein AN958_03810 [Leucoagaricus sp. SymC.cos]